MIKRVHILIDFENVQPPAGELERIRGSQYRVGIFHGPHQTRFDAAVVKALQPLGGQVEDIQGERSGRNALDFHIAFYLGRAVHGHDGGGPASSDRYLIVTKDGGFDPLLEHLRSQGHEAEKVRTVSEAVGIGRVVPTPPLPQPPPSLAPRPSASKAPAKVTATPTNGSAADPRSKILDNLRAHPKNRPLTRVALVRHVVTLLGNKPTAKAVEALVAGLEREGIVKLQDKKVVYAVPKKEK